MSNLFTQFLLFAQEAGGEAAQPGAEGNNAPGPLIPWPILIAFLVFGWFFLIRPQQRERKKHQSVLDNLKKNDQVQTIGGIVGTIVNVDEKFVTLKVDDNTRIKMRRTSIQGLLEEEQSS